VVIGAVEITRLCKRRPTLELLEPLDRGDRNVASAVVGCPSGPGMNAIVRNGASSTFGNQASRRRAHEMGAEKGSGEGAARSDSGLGDHVARKVPPSPRTTEASNPGRRADMTAEPPDYLADAWLRHKWANESGEAFHKLCVEFTRTDPYLVYARWEAERWEVSFQGPRNAEFVTPVLNELSRLLGTFLDHMRAALNYTAVQVAHLAFREDPSLTELHPNAVEFPIFNSETLYTKQNRLKKLPAKYAKPINSVQPFHGGHDALWRLHELAAQYRHHLVHPALVWADASKHRVIVGGEEMAPSDLERFPQTRLEVGDVLMRFNLPGVEPGTPVDVRAALSIGIDHPLCEGREAVGLLNEIIKDVTGVMGGIEEDVFGLRPAPGS
jgi:hypothetical protein